MSSNDECGESTQSNFSTSDTTESTFLSAVEDSMKSLTLVVRNDRQKEASEAEGTESSESSTLNAPSTSSTATAFESSYLSQERCDDSDPALLPCVSDGTFASNEEYFKSKIILQPVMIDLERKVVTDLESHDETELSSDTVINVVELDEVCIKRLKGNVDVGFEGRVEQDLEGTLVIQLENYVVRDFGDQIVTHPSSDASQESTGGTSDNDKNRLALPRLDDLESAGAIDFSSASNTEQLESEVVIHSVATDPTRKMEMDLEGNLEVEPVQTDVESNVETAPSIESAEGKGNHSNILEDLENSNKPTTETCGDDSSDSEVYFGPVTKKEEMKMVEVKVERYLTSEDRLKRRNSLP